MAAFVLSAGEGSATLLSEHELNITRPMYDLAPEDLASWTFDALLGTCYATSNLMNAVGSFDDGDEVHFLGEDGELLLVLDGPCGECWVRLEHA